MENLAILYLHIYISYEEFTQFEPYTPQCKKLKNVELVSLALKVMHKKKNNIITDGSVTTVVLHIR